MFKELKHQLSEKYLLIIIPILAFIIIGAISMGSGYENVSSDFSNEIEFCSSYHLQQFTYFTSTC